MKPLIQWWGNQGIPIVIVLLACTSIAGFSQPRPRFQHLTVEDGLLANDATSIIRDVEGYIWICSSLGVSRFDGVRVQALGFDSQRARCSYQDKNNNLWFGTSTKLIFMNSRRSDTITYNSKNGGLNGVLNAICEDEQGVIWVGTTGGIFAFDKTTHSFSKCIRDTTKVEGMSPRSDQVLRLLPDHDGNIWMGTYYGLYKLSTKTREIARVEPYNDKTLNSKLITGLAFDANGQIWAGTSDGLFTYDTTANKLSAIKLPHGYSIIRTLYTKDLEKIWIAVGTNGVIVANAKTRSFEEVYNYPYDQTSLAGDKVNCFYQDETGMMWIGTGGFGVDRLSPRHEKFPKYLREPGSPGAFDSDEVYGVDEDSVKNLWIATHKGLVFWDRRQNTFKSFRHDPTNPNSPATNEINDVKVDGNGIVWAATNRGLNRYDPNSHQWKLFSHNELSAARRTFCVCITSHGKILVGTEVGVCIFNQHLQKLETRDHYPMLSKSVPVNFYIRQIFEDSRHNLWIATSNDGAFNLKSTFESTGILEKNRLNNNRVSFFSEDSFGNIWVSGEEWIYRINPVVGEISSFGPSQGVPDNALSSIVVISPNEIWAGGNSGLTWLTLQKDSVRVKNFKRSDGLQGSTFNSAALRLSTGELFFGGTHGFNLFDPKEIRFNEEIPPIYISSLQIMGKDVPFEYGKPITMNYDENFFSFETTALNYDHPEQNQFAHQLEGFDDEMQYTGTRNYVSYTNVPPGEYVLHVIGSNNDGLWNEEGIRIPVIIKPPFWELLWVQVATALFTVVMLTGAYKIRTNMIRKTEREKAELSRKVLEARHAAMRAQMNPHFIFNCLNSINNYIVQSETEQASNYLIKFSKLIRLVLEISAQEEITLEQELQMIDLYIQLELLRFSNKFSYSINVDTAIDEGIKIPPMILQPFIENSIWHGLMRKKENGELSVELYRENSWIICSITDNGIGREAATKHASRDKKSFGIDITMNRLKSMNGVPASESMVAVTDLYNPDGSPAGTMVKVKIARDYDD